MKNINLISPINSLGYGQVGLNVYKELDKQANVALMPIGQIGVSNHKDGNLIAKGMQRCDNVDFSAPCLRIWHQHDMSQFVGNGPKIGFPIFELDRFTDREYHHLSHLDYIFVCSHWAKEIVLKNLNDRDSTYEEDRVRVVPLGVNSHEFDVFHVGGSTNFFTCGKWEIRKGHDFLINAFCRAFDSSDDVMLYMMCDNPFLDKKQESEWKSLYMNSPMGHRVRFISRVQTHEEVMQQMSNMDCGLFLSRAEGWNLELLEMMSIGKHVIATNYSGHTEFCNEDNAYLVNVDKLQSAVDNIWFHGQGMWAELGENQMKQTVDHMRFVHDQKQSGNLYINTSGLQTAQKFTWENTARNILEHVKEIDKR